MMPKFKVGDKVRLTIKDSCYLKGFQDNDVCIIIRNGCGGKKEYRIKLLSEGTIGYAMEDELELVDAIIKIGDTVQPKSFCIGYPDYFRIVGIKRGCNISYDLEQLTFNGKTLNTMQLQNWEEIDFNVVPSTTHPMDIVTQQVLADIKMPLHIDKIQNQIEAYEEIFSKEGENYMKILGIYSRKANSMIENKYDELEKEVRENDSVNKIIQDASNQINVLLNRDEKNAIDLIPTGIYSELLEPKSSEKIVELKREREREERNVEKLIEEVKARLEICDDNETSKVAVLKEYGILDKDGRIAEYKIEKKGRK